MPHLPLFWAGLCLYGAIFALGRVLGSPLLIRDFTNLWLAGQLVLAGDTNSIFDLDAFQSATEASVGVHWSNNYSYPPHALFLAVPFGALPYPIAYAAWNLASAGLFYWAARPYLPRQLPGWVTIISPAALMCFAYGHYGLIVGALWLWSFRGNGFAAAAMTIKPHLGLLVAVQMLINRSGLLLAIGWTCAFVAASIAVFGFEPWRAFFTVTIGYQTGLLDASRAALATNMITPYISYGIMGQVVCAIAAIYLLTRCFNVFTAATATFLIVPYGFHYDLTVVCLGFAVLLTERWQSLSLTERSIACLTFLAPALVSFGAWLIPPILLAGLYIQVQAMRSTIKPLSDVEASVG